jgi:hypothetical protein
MHTRFVSLIAGAALLLMPVYAMRKTSSGQAYRGLFRAEHCHDGEALTLNGAIGAGWDSNLFLAQRDQVLISGVPILPEHAI